MSEEAPDRRDQDDDARRDDDNEGGVAVKEETATKTKSKTKSKPKSSPPKMDHLPPWRVLLHNDDHNTFDHVIRAIRELTPLDLSMAVTRTYEAHIRGVSLLMVTHRERAELYRDQFRTKRLTVTIEPMDA